MHNRIRTKNKTRSLRFGKKTKVFQGSLPFTVDDGINQLQEKADAYQQTLCSVDEMVGDFIEKNILAVTTD